MEIKLTEEQEQFCVREDAHFKAACPHEKMHLEKARSKWLHRLHRRLGSQRAAAERLGISEPQFRRMACWDIMTPAKVAFLAELLCREIK